MCGVFLLWPTLGNNVHHIHHYVVEERLMIGDSTHE